MQYKEWIPNKEPDKHLAEQLGKEVNVGTDLAGLLIQRGVNNFEEAHKFFRPSLNDLHDPFLMKGMGIAVDRIITAIKKKETMMIYGDYDVDGTSAVALVWMFLSKIYGNVLFYIPDRYNEGYGISFTGIDRAAESGATLMIALDCGIKAVDKVAYARTKNIDFIICDHHLPGNELPQALAILNPKQADCPYPFKELPGCGIGFKLCQALTQKMNLEMPPLLEYLDLVAMAIGADIVPIVGENRILTYNGLKKLKENPNHGFRALLEFYYEKPFYEVSDLVFSVGPRINAAGRMAHGSEAVQLMASSSIEDAREHAKLINSRNTDRQGVDKTITADALDMLFKDPKIADKKSTVVYNPLWHKGVVGIVASRLIEKYHRPTIVLCESNGKATGSARSVNDFDIYNAIEKCSDLLEQFGGHQFAAGMTMTLENVPIFIDKFEQVVSQSITAAQLMPSIVYDMEIPISRITPKFIAIINQFAPFGPHNMNPVFLSRNVWDTGYAKQVGNGGHLSMNITQADGTKPMRAIGFGLGDAYEGVSSGRSFDMLYTIEENHFNGNVTVQLNLKDLKFTN